MPHSHKSAGEHERLCDRRAPKWPWKPSWNLSPGGGPCQTATDVACATGRFIKVAAHWDTRRGLGTRLCPSPSLPHWRWSNVLDQWSWRHSLHVGDNGRQSSVLDCKSRHCVGHAGLRSNALDHRSRRCVDHKRRSWAVATGSTGNVITAASEPPTVVAGKLRTCFFPMEEKETLRNCSLDHRSWCDILNDWWHSCTGLGRRCSMYLTTRVDTAEVKAGIVALQPTPGYCFMMSAHDWNLLPVPRLKCVPSPVLPSCKPGVRLRSNVWHGRSKASKNSTYARSASSALNRTVPRRFRAHVKSSSWLKPGVDSPLQLTSERAVEIPRFSTSKPPPATARDRPCDRKRASGRRRSSCTDILRRGIVLHALRVADRRLLGSSQLGGSEAGAIPSLSRRSIGIRAALGAAERTAPPRCTTEKAGPPPLRCHQERVQTREKRKPTEQKNNLTKKATLTHRTPTYTGTSFVRIFPKSSN